MRKTFAVVVRRGERISVAGTPEAVSRLVPEHSPNAILPGDWPVGSMAHADGPTPVPGYGSKGARLLQRATGRSRVVWTPETGWLV